VAAADRKSVERSESRGRAALLTADRPGGGRGGDASASEPGLRAGAWAALPEVTCDFVGKAAEVFRGNFRGGRDPACREGPGADAALRHERHMAPEASSTRDGAPECLEERSLVQRHAWRGGAWCPAADLSPGRYQPQVLIFFLAPRERRLCRSAKKVGPKTQCKQSRRQILAAESMATSTPVEAHRFKSMGSIIRPRV
jgi:hypothetical protein